MISDKKYKMKFSYENVKMAFVIHKVTDEISWASFLNVDELQKREFDAKVKDFFEKFNMKKFEDEENPNLE